MVVLFQITPESLPMYWTHPSLSTSVHIGHTSLAIRHFLLLHGWHEAVVIHSPDQWYADTAESLREMLSENEVQVITAPMDEGVMGILKVKDPLNHTAIMISQSICRFTYSYQSIHQYLTILLAIC